MLFTLHRYIVIVMATDMLPKLTSSDYTRGIGVTLLTPRARGSFT